MEVIMAGPAKSNIARTPRRRPASTSRICSLVRSDNVGCLTISVIAFLQPGGSVADFYLQLILNCTIWEIGQASIIFANHYHLQKEQSRP
jgi:hypothetical protein